MELMAAVVLIMVALAWDVPKLIQAKIQEIGLRIHKTEKEIVLLEEECRKRVKRHE